MGLEEAKVLYAHFKEKGMEAEADNLRQRFLREEKVDLEDKPKKKKKNEKPKRRAKQRDKL